MRKRAGELLDRAAQLKATKDGQYMPRASTPAATPVVTKTRRPLQRLAEPRSTRKLTKAEQIVLMRGSKLNGSKFAPWSAAPSPGEFADDSGEAFTYGSFHTTEVQTLTNQ